jgi:predicted TIM-barrel fold metal-dependent hydrolase
MIDGHVHAFPTMLPAAVTRAAQRIGRLADAFLPKGPLLGIERAASLQVKGRAYHQRIENAATLVMLPSVMVNGTCDGLLAAMDRSGASRVVLIGSKGVASNDWLLGEARRVGGDRFVPVATLPDLPAGASSNAWLDAYDALARQGARGFKIHSNWDDVGADHPSVPALFEVAAKHRLFVILHTGCFHVPNYKRKNACDISTFERFFDAFPSVKVCLAHMNRDRPEGAWDIMKKHEQVFADTSWQPTAAIAKAVETVGAERLMLGSDWPLLHKDLISDARTRVEEAARGAALDQLLEGSARRFMGETA